jgi:hypothetical protein
MRAIVIAAKKGLPNWTSPQHLQMFPLSPSREEALTWTNSAVRALPRFHNSLYQTSNGKTFILCRLPPVLSPPIIWANRVPYFPTTNCLISPHFRYPSILPPPRFLCLLRLFLLFDRLPSNKLLKGSVLQLFLEKIHASHLTLVQKLLLVIFAEVRLLWKCSFIHVLNLGLLARKTKCDGAHPACASCARRSLHCTYNQESGPLNGPGSKKGRRASSSKPPADPSHSLSPPSSRMVPTPNDGYEQGDIYMPSELDMKRPLEYQDISRPPKRMRMENPAATAGIP